MNLPEKSTWHILRGTWFVYSNEGKTVHIQLKNNGLQSIFVNDQLVSQKRSLKLRTEQEFQNDGSKYLVRISPENVAMTSFSTELIIDNELKRVFHFSYRTDFKRYLPFILVIVGLTIPLTIFKFPTWSYYVMLGVVVLLKLLIFNKDMFYISESDNPIKVDI